VDYRLDPVTGVIAQIRDPGSVTHAEVLAERERILLRDELHAEEMP
jgi:hypothetical protein